MLIRLTVDRGGRVLGVALARSSESAGLDEATLQQPHGRQVPTSPPSTAQGATTLPLSII